MKKPLSLTTAFLLGSFAYAQSLTFDNTLPLDNTVAYQYPSASDESHTIQVFLEDDSSDKNYKLSVTISAKSTAALMRDFELNLAGLAAGADSHNPASFVVTIKQNTAVINRFILLDIKAASDDTVFHTQLKIVLTTNPEKVHPTDRTNTPKFEFVTYTDFKGYDPEEPNGVAQSQFLFKLPINRHYKLWKDGETQRQWLRSFLPVSFLFNRIDKSSQPLSLKPTYTKYEDSVSVSSIISSFDFIRYSNFIYNPKLTVFTLIRPNSRVQFQLTGNLYRLKIDSATVTRNLTTTDSAITSVDTALALNRVWSYSPGAELYYDTHYSPDEFPFNFRLIAGVQFIKLISHEYKQADVASTSPFNNTKTAVLIDGDKRKFSAPIWNLSLMIKKNLDLKKKDSEGEDHYLFFRFNYYWQGFNGYNLISKNPVRYTPQKFSNNFSQFQLGVDLNFDGFFK